MSYETVIREIMRLVGAPEETIGIFRTACMHGSWVNEQANREATTKFESNERLEFLGDSVLGLIIAETLYRQMPERDEGILSKAKARLVSTQTLATCASQLNIGDALLLGKGEEASGGRVRPALIANAMEAFIGTVFLACGFERTKKFVLDIWKQAVSAELEGLIAEDYKTTLQEYSQSQINELPEYQLVNIIGPDHDREYEMAVFVRGEEKGRGRGKSKKSAEQNAAAAALLQMKNETSKTREES